MAKYRQGPNEHIDYFVDVLNDTIASTVWTIDPPAGATLGTPSDSLTRTICRVSGLAAGQTYFLQCDLTLVSGQVRTSRVQITGGYSQQ